MRSTLLMTWRGIAALAFLYGAPSASPAQQGGNDATSLAKASQNPIGDLVSVPIQFNFFSGGDLQDRSFYNLNVQPVFPMPIGRDWAIIARTIVPYVSTPMPTARISGLGDIQQQFFFTPAAPGQLIWGAGPMFSFPTATNDLARTGAWGLGPAAVFLRNVDPFLAGFLLTQVWTFASYQNERPNISVMNLQPFINWNLSDGWAITTAPIIVGNWTAPDGQQWTVPLGAGFSKVTALGSRPLNLSVQYYRNVIRPDGAGADQLKLVVSFLFPKSS
jgi:hypothetical protein